MVKTFVRHYPVEFRMWDVFVACYYFRDLRKVARDTGCSKDLNEWKKGEVWKPVASEEEHVAYSVPAHAELSQQHGEDVKMSEQRFAPPRLPSVVRPTRCPTDLD
jgi:hypothetical protein